MSAPRAYTGDMSSTRTIKDRRLAALAAGVLLNMTFGSLYAWSVFIDGLEADLGIMRTDVSIVFSLAVVTFTAGNFIAPFLYGRLPTVMLPVLAAALAAGGLAISATGGGYQSVIAGYGVMFGFGSGLAYNTALQSAQEAIPSRPGLANGIVISAFASGSIVAAYLLSGNIADMGVSSAFWALGLVVAAAGAAATLALWLSGVHLPRQPLRGHAKEDRRILGICWLGFFLGALAGILSIGHAAEIIKHFGGTVEWAVLGVTLLAFGNALGRLGAGWMSDHVSVRSVAGIAHLTGAIGFVVVLANPTGDGAMIAMTLAGISYGMSAGIYPSALAIFLGPDGYGRNVGILLTAWGAAGLIGPLAGGYFFDLTSDYRIPLEFACAASVLAVVNAMRLPRSNAGQQVP